ncbi:mevalonate kinase [uncultured Secundilactobacillus sp.]|uniref:mevalonate kinase n=1 Tax=uncultured Secundilactobacillus sp. TaxID=2813935 RepID=UPI0025842F2A|nr:mevalonate kinase [uncultured Secundilactobacillus sp.]
MLKQAMGVSHAKVILIGEHSVVYQKPAIALPLPAVKTTAKITPLNNGQQRFASRYYSGPRQTAPIELEGINALIDTLLARFHAIDSAFELKIHSDLPAERGMGSSAATAVAIIRALYQAFGQPLTHEQLRADADISEHIIHGNPSGLDVATTSADAAVWFHKGEDPVDLPFHLTSYLVVADSGIHGQTGLAVKHVADFKEAHNRLATHAINHLGALTEAARDALLKNDVLHLGQVLNRAQAELRTLGVSHPRLDQMIQVARQNGAVGAKLTGGGMGGCIIALAKTAKDAAKITTALKQMNILETWTQPFLSEEVVYDDAN